MLDQASRAASVPSVTVTAPARLHLGFLDMHGGLGRRFGSIGLCLTDIATRIRVSKDKAINVSGPFAQRAAGHARYILDELGLTQGVQIEVIEAIPEHVGLGSGTKLALAIGTAICHLFDRPLSTERLARFLRRGARSGIGIGTFSKGGFIIDGGHGDLTDTPPIIARLPFPEEWRVILAFDHIRQGLNSADEKQAFIRLPKMHAAVSASICRSVLMQLLPAIHECDCQAFGQSISFIQQAVGDYFAPVQQGRYCSVHMHQVLADLCDLGGSGSGQSSWGPTGFAFYPNEAMAVQALATIRKSWAAQPHLEFRLCKGRNLPADIENGQLVGRPDQAPATQRL